VNVSLQDADTTTSRNWALVRPVRGSAGVDTSVDMEGERRDARGAVVTADLLARARAGDGDAFRALTEPHRRELQVHCYRMLGSFQDAGNALQNTRLAAWQGLGAFEGRASIRTWLYRIATNRCLNALRSASRRPAMEWYTPRSRARPMLNRPIRPTSAKSAISVVDAPAMLRMDRFTLHEHGDELLDTPARVSTRFALWTR
jgi:DNA-directed RNA polymerase specialized sigma24 family protein